MKKSALAVALAAVLIAPRATASPNIQITEIWPGGLPGGEATSDWFELTNFGDMAATGLDGNLYYDDDSFDATKNTPLLGVDTISPGESVIYVVSWEDGFTSASDAVTAFTAMWGAPAGDLTGIQIGHVDGGGGLGGGGDAVVIFDGNTASATAVDFELYSVSSQVESFVSAADGTWTNNTFAQVGVLGAYAGNANATNDPGSSPPIGSPGTPGSDVPEPAGIALAALGMLLVAMRRR